MKSICIPKLRFQNGWLLTDAFMYYRKQIPQFKNRRPPSWDKTNASIKKKEKLWKEQERKIVSAMQKITGLNFYQDLIDVYFVYGWFSAFSNPMVLSIHYEDDDLVDILTHELLHRLLTDNVQRKNGGLWPRRMCPKIKDTKVISHILVHAVHKEIYLNVLKQPDRLQRDIEKCKKWPAYRRSWHIVNRDGHHHIIEKFRKLK